MNLPRATRTAIIVIAVALLIETVRALGVEQVLAGVARVGWGFAIILIVAGVRDAARAFAWTLSADGGALPFMAAFRARLGGEALNTLLPMGVIVGEPMKASHVGDHLPFLEAGRALVLEFAFYTASLLPLLALGVSTFAFLSGVPVTVIGMAAALAAAAIAAVLAVRWPPAWPIAARRAAIIIACEIAYQLLSVGELYFTLALILPHAPSVASVLVLETVNRLVTIVFKMVPLRVGVDEAASLFTAARLHLDPAAGLAVALVRKLRLLFWSAVGLMFLVRRPARITRTVRAGAVLATSSVILLAISSSFSIVAAQTTAPTVTGSVSIATPDGSPVLIPGVTLTLTCGNSAPITAVSNEQGEFSFTVAATAPRECSLVAELQGFASAKTAVHVSEREAPPVALTLGLDTLHEEITVHAPATARADSSIDANVHRMTTAVMNTAPLASERFQDALPLIPGVVRGPDGLLNINGARSNQTGLTFNSAEGTDPATGEDAIELPIDAVSSVQVRGAAFAPEFGLSAGAMTTVETQKAGEAWHATVNDLEPRVRLRGGEFRGFESWTPRVTIGGPVMPGVSVLESIQYEYSQTQVFGLPAFQSDTEVRTFESYSRVDWNIGSANHLTGSVLASPRTTRFAGLNTLNPQPVTPSIESTNVLASVSDQRVTPHGALFETRLSVMQFDADIHPSQGSDPMRLLPAVNTGSYFNDQERTARRIDWLSTYSFTPFGPDQLVKVGAGVKGESLDGTSTSRPVEIARADGTLDERIAFVGDGRLDRERLGSYGFGQDTWTPSPRVTIVAGARYDYDSVTDDVNIAPRASFTAVASEDGRTVVRGGAGLFYDPIPLNVAAFDQMQRRTIERFLADGLTPAGAIVSMPNVVASSIHTPRSENWNLELDREWVHNLFVRVGYQERRSHFEPIVDQASMAGGPAALLLRTDGQSRYREGQVVARYQLRGTDQIVAAYTRSTATGDLNDFNNYFGNIEDPIVTPDVRGPLPWDAPNRVLIWSHLDVPHGFTVFPLLEVRTGFPLSLLDEDHNFIGERDGAGRYPTFVSLDLQVSKRFRVFHHNATLGVKVFNVTDHFNPRDFQGNVASAEFGGFNNSVGRTFRGKWVFEF